MTMPNYLIPIYFIFLAAVWGASFMFMRVAVPEFGPYAFAGLRVSLAGLVLLPLLLQSKRLNELKQHWLSLSVIGILATGLPFTLFSYAAQSLNAGTNSVINATTPLMTGVLAHLLLKSYLNKYQVIGLIISILGVSVLMYHGMQSDNSHLLAFIAALLACFCYALSSNLTKQYLSHLSPITVATVGLLASGIVTLPLTATTFPEHPISLAAWGAVIFVAIISTAIAMILFYQLIQTIGPTKTSTLTPLTPVFGILWGILFLGEPLTLNMVIGSLMILSGTALSIFFRK